MHDKIVNEITWVIGGAQGSGVDSAANIFSKTCAERWVIYFWKTRILFKYKRRT